MSSLLYLNTLMSTSSPDLNFGAPAGGTHPPAYDEKTYARIFAGLEERNKNWREYRPGQPGTERIALSVGKRDIARAEQLAQTEARLQSVQAKVAEVFRRDIHTPESVYSEWQGGNRPAEVRPNKTGEAYALPSNVERAIDNSRYSAGKDSPLSKNNVLKGFSRLVDSPDDADFASKWAPVNKSTGQAEAWNAPWYKRFGLAAARAIKPVSSGMRVPLNTSTDVPATNEIPASAARALKIVQDIDDKWTTRPDRLAPYSDIARNDAEVQASYNKGSKPLYVDPEKIFVPNRKKTHSVLSKVWNGVLDAGNYVREKIASGLKRLSRIF